MSKGVELELELIQPHMAQKPKGVVPEIAAERAEKGKKRKENSQSS